MFKPLMAGYYQATYERLLGEDPSGGLLHVDETEVSCRRAKATSGCSRTWKRSCSCTGRPGKAISCKELLKDFRGVLVSDFYAAYDSIDCPQQKCLIHLIRDINQDMLSNPFDEELKSITRPSAPCCGRSSRPWTSTA